MNPVTYCTTLLPCLFLAACGDSGSSFPVSAAPTQSAATISQPGWRSIGPSPAAIEAPVAVHAASGSMYVATFGGGVLKSNPAGSFAQEINAGLNAKTTSSMVMVPGDPQTLYAGTFGGGLFKSLDGGASWSLTGEIAGNSLFLAVDPANTNTIYATYNGAVPIRKSVDGGTTWKDSATGIPATAVFTLSIDARDPRMLYAGSTGNGAFRSTDAGASWTAMNIQPTVWALLIDLANSSIVYAGTDGSGVYKSVDAGLSWSRKGSPAAGVVLSLVKQGTRLIAGTANGGIFLSDDDGVTWRASGKRDGIVGSLVLADDGALYAGTAASGVLKSTDGGETWQSHGVNNAVFSCYCQNGHAIVVDPDDGSRALFSTNDGGMFAVAANPVGTSSTWSAVADGMETRSPRGIVFNPRDPLKVYAGAFTGGGLYMSRDHGRTWQRKLFGPAGIHVTGMDLTPDGSTLYLTTIGGAGLWKSVDDGSTFQRIDVAAAGGPFLNLAGRGIAVDQDGGPNVYHAGTTGVWRSTDRGATWSRIVTTSATSVTIHPVERNVILVGTQANGVLKSTDYGASFFEINNGLTTLRIARTSSVQVHRSAPNVYYVGTEGGGVFKSKDSGATWTAVNAGLTNLTVYGLAIDPNAPGRLYAATEGSVFVTTNGGE